MDQEIDLETVLRGHFRANPEKAVPVTMWLNSEGRIVAKIDAVEFVVFGNNVRQYPPPKPPAQHAAVQGFEAYKGMGEH